METLYNILVILPNNLGDILMATPLLMGLKKRYPDSSITFFAEKGFEDGILNNSYLDSIFTFNRKLIKDFFQNSKFEKGKGIFRDIINNLNHTHYDLLINLSQHPYTSCLSSLIESKKILGCHFLKEGNDAIIDRWSLFLYAIPYARRYNSFHAADIYRRIGGVYSHGCKYTINLTNKEIKAAGEFLSEMGVDTNSGRLIVFQPGAALQSKRWPAGNFIILGKMLAENGWQIIISGAPEEKELAANIQKGIGANAFVSAGRTGFRQAVANLSLAKACITGDTALMHAAAALNIKTYALFGATSPVETGPYGNDHLIFSGKCPKKTCFYNKCKTMSCMKSILPEHIFFFLTNNTSVHIYGCDIYRTSINKNHDYEITPLTKQSYRYFDKFGTLLVKKAFGEKLSMENVSLPEMKRHLKDSESFLMLLSKMKINLLTYIDKKDATFLHLFEKQKETLSQISGIADFWSALLNLRLNSIPILDPVKSIHLSIKACMLTETQIQTAISQFQGVSDGRAI